MDDIASCELRRRAICRLRRYNAIGVSSNKKKRDRAGRLALVTAAETWSYVHGLMPLRHEVGMRTSGRRSRNSPSLARRAGGRRPCRRLCHPNRPVALAELERRAELVLRRLQEVAWR